MNGFLTEVRHDRSEPLRVPIENRWVVQYGLPSPDQLAMRPGGRWAIYHPAEIYVHSTGDVYWALDVRAEDPSAPVFALYMFDRFNRDPVWVPCGDTISLGDFVKREVVLDRAQAKAAYAL